MSTDTPFYRCAETVMLRAPLRPFRPLPTLYPDTLEGGPSEAQELTDWIRDTVTNDAVLREAVQISSPSLTRVLNQVLAGTELRPRSARRAAKSLTRYLLRMHSRSTPFGVLAGVAPARIGTDASVQWGGEHRKTASIDLGWLDSWVRQCERRPAVLTHLQVVVNNLCRIRGERLILPTGHTPQGNPAQVSVHLSDPVRTVLDSARSPTAYREIRGRLQKHHPDVPGSVIDSLLQQMADLGLLLTQLPPVPGAPDPLRHVMSVLKGFPVDALPSEVTAELDRLRRIRQDLALYSRQPVGFGLDLVRSTQQRLQAIHSVANEQGIQIDLALGVDVQLPRLVASEAEATAGALSRLGGPYPASLHDFHRRFVNRYGVDTLVPVKEVLDPEKGVAPPTGYRNSPRTTRTALSGQESRDRILSSLAQEATLLGREVVLDEASVSELSGSRPHHPPPVEVELCAHLLASSTDALESGDFLLALTSAFGSPAIGAMINRFAHLFEDRQRARQGCPSSAIPTAASEPLRAQLVFPPLHPRSLNVLRGPEQADHIIPLGTFADPRDPKILDPDDLFVAATPHRLYVYSHSRRQEVTPVGLHSLNYRSQAPELVRLLREIGLSGTRPWQPWSWGSAAHLPRLPRVRYRRTILAPARWRVPVSLHNPDEDFGRWQRVSGQWRDTWGVPDRVQVLAPNVSRDRHLILDLEEDSHRLLFREEVLQHDEVVVSEYLSGTPETTGWSAGHSNEIVFPLTLGERSTPRPEPVPLVRYDHATEHLPGGSWLSSQLACAPEHTEDLISTHLPRLLEDLPIESWFFVRYDDPHPHLRLRFHGAPDTLNSTVLPRLRHWVATLRQSGLVDCLDLSTYAPEVGRYGSGDAMTAAERVFFTDSRSVLAQLRYLHSSRTNIPPVVLAAANNVDIAHSLLGTSAAEWFDCLPKSPHHHVFRTHRDVALAIINPAADWAGLRNTPGGDGIVASWKPRRAALEAYRAQIDEATTSCPHSEKVLTSLLHMHANRLLGIDREMEAQSIAVARAAVRAHQQRTANTRTP